MRGARDRAACLGKAAGRFRCPTAAGWQMRRPHWNTSRAKPSRRPSIQRAWPASAPRSQRRRNARRGWASTASRSTAPSGGVSPLQKIAVGPGYQVPFAEAIKKAADITTIAVGLITDPQQAEDIIARGKADLVALARAMLYDPRWPWHAAAQLGATV